MRYTYPSLFDPVRSVEVWFCDDACCDGKKLHRDGAPAVIFADGTEEWWQHGTRLTDAETTANKRAFYQSAFSKGSERPVTILSPLRIRPRVVSHGARPESADKGNADD